MLLVALIIKDFHQKLTGASVSPEMNSNFYNLLFTFC